MGTRTAAHDNPHLSVRAWIGRDPVRIVIDRFLRLNGKLHLFDGKQKTLCYNLLKHEEHPNLILQRIEEQPFIENLLTSLWKNKIQSVIVEGGATTLSLFTEKQLWDEARIF